MRLRVSADPARLSRAAMGTASPEATGADMAGWLGVALAQPAFRVEVRGTTGAGDATIGGLLGAMLRGHSAATCAALACATGACSVEVGLAVGAMNLAPCAGACILKTGVPHGRHAEF